MLDFEPHIRFTLAVYIKCTNCGIELMIDDNGFADQGVDADIKRAVKSVVHQAKKYKWQISNLRMDDECPVCQKCFETGGK